MVLLPEPDTPITTSAQGIRLMLLSTKILRKRCLVDKPDRLAHRLRAVRRQVLALQHPRQDRALVRAGDLEQHFTAGVERRQGQRDPRHEWCDMRRRHADHPTLGLLEGWIAGK